MLEADIKQLVQQDRMVLAVWQDTQASQQERDLTTPPLMVACFLKHLLQEAQRRWRLDHPEGVAGGNEPPIFCQASAILNLELTQLAHAALRHARDLIAAGADSSRVSAPGP